MSRISRRDFLAGLTLAGAAASMGRLTSAAEPNARPKRGTDVVTLGRTGLKTTVLGIGTGTVGGSQQRALGTEGFTKLARHALDRGIRYIDTADMYHMHVFIQIALKGVPRDKYFIQTKTMAKHPQVAKADIERFRQELGVETIDLLLMHCMQTGSWPTDMRPVMDVLDEAKRKGRVRAVGISNHGWEPLTAAAESDWCDVQLVRINPFGDKMDAEPQKVAGQLKKIHAKGRGVLGMKIYGETGFGSREKRLQSLKYVLGLGCVDAFTIGFTSTQQLDETLDLIEQSAQSAA
jgi:aryl-alcohol dehydrogenase-like predicted oxidoreductase